MPEEEVTPGEELLQKPEDLLIEDVVDESVDNVVVEEEEVA